MAILAINTKTVENPFRIQGLISVLWLHNSLAEYDFKVWNKTQMNHTQLYSKQYMQIQEEDSQTSLSGMRLLSDCTTLLQKCFKDWNQKMNHLAQLHLKTNLCKSKKNLIENHKIRNQC
jgi:hypothetical protein